MMIPEQNLKKMIGDNPYYFNINKTVKYGFNWAAAFFGSLWMLYRNLYALAIPWVILWGWIDYNLLFKIMGRISSNLGILITALIVIVPFSIDGFLGNRIYFYFLKEMDKKSLVPLMQDRRASIILLTMAVIATAMFMILIIMNGKDLVSWDIRLILRERNISFALISIVINLGVFWIFGKEKRPEVFFFPFPQLFQKMKGKS